MTDQFRDLCAELVNTTGTDFLAALERARAALAQPVPEGPTDEALMAVYQRAYRSAWERSEYIGAHIDGLRAVLARWGRPTPPPADGDVATDEQLYDLADEYNGEPVASMRAALSRWGSPAAQPPAEGEVATDDELDLVVIAIQALTPHQPDATTHDLAAVDRGREILRQQLARWGCPAAPPAEGEVGELVTALRDPCIAPLLRERTRAAELLERQQPVAVALPEAPPPHLLPSGCDLDEWGRVVRETWKAARREVERQQNVQAPRSENV